MLLTLPLLLAPLPQTTWHVDAAGVPPGTGTIADPYTRIDYCVSQPNVVDGDTVLVAPGNYVGEHIHIASKTLHLQSTAGPEATTIRGVTGNPGSLLKFTSGLITVNQSTVEGFTFTQGNGEPIQQGGPAHAGGAVFIDRSLPTFRNCHFSDNDALLGGHLYAVQEPLNSLAAPFLFEDCTFADASTGNGHGAAFYLDGGNARFTGCTFTNNNSGRSGAGYGEGATVEFRDCLFDNNLTGNDGGTAKFVNCSVSLIDSQVLRGWASLNGGGFYMNGGSFLAVNSRFEENNSTDGGALFLRNVSSLIQSTVFLNNIAAELRNGGAILQVGGNLTLTDVTFTQNEAARGGAVFSFGNNGDGTADPNVFMLLQGCDFVGNRASSSKSLSPSGGAIYAATPMTVTDCTFEGNYARTDKLPLAQGGAISSHFSSQIHDSIFRDNYAQGMAEVLGGAIFASTHQTLERCQFYGNQVVGGSLMRGAALRGPIGADFCTLRDNHATEPCIYAVDGAWLHNSIVWGNAPQQVHPDTLVHFSLVEGGVPGQVVLTGAPHFWGPEDSHLMPASSAIDQADPTAPLDDNGTRADLGAIPFDPLYCGPGCDGPIGTITCQSNPNSTGQVGTIAAVGSTDLSKDLFILHATQIPVGKPGYFLGANGTDFVPGFGGSQGVLCLGPPVLLRFNAQVAYSGPAGEYTQQFAPSDFPDGHWVMPGETWHFQAWFRDFVGVEPTSNTTDAISILFP